MKKNELIRDVDEFIKALGYDCVVLPYSYRLRSNGKEVYCDVFRVSGCEYYLSCGYYDDNTIYVDFSRRPLNKDYFTHYSTYLFDLSSKSSFLKDIDLKVEGDYFTIRRFIFSFFSGGSNA